MALISDNYMKALLKTVYENGVYNAKYQNSPVLSAIGKKAWGAGKEIKYAANYGNGGNFASDFSILQSGTDASGNGYGARNLEWTMTQGYLTGMFDINQPEILTSSEDRGAYMKILSNKMESVFDGLSKTLALYLYGGKKGVIDRVKADTVLAATGNKLSITSAGAIKMDLGTRFVFASAGADNTAVPSSPILSGYCTVTAIDDAEVTFDASSALVGKTVYVGDYLELYGSSKNGIEGLSDLIPHLNDRTGTEWDTYIGTDFRGVDRSMAANRLAGQFVKAATTGDTRLTDALVTLLKKTKRAGGLNNTIIINDETWDKVGQELGVQANLWQATDGAPKSQGATAGFSALATAFGDAFIGRTVIDPFCTEDIAYSIEKDDLQFYDLGNVSRVIDPVSNDQMGKHDIESVGDQGFGDNFSPAINVDKLFTVTQGTSGEFGPTFNIAAHIFGNFKIGKTASAGVANLA